VNQPIWLVLQQPNTLGIIKVRNCWNKARYPFSCILVDVALKKPLLSPMLESFVGEIDTELIE
jgi:hypothetical protein